MDLLFIALIVAFFALTAGTGPLLRQPHGPAGAPMNWIYWLAALPPSASSST